VKQIAFTLSFITKDPAQVWAATYCQQCIISMNFGMFKDFVQEFTINFEQHHTQEESIHWLTIKHMSLVKDKIRSIKKKDGLVEYNPPLPPTLLNSRIMSTLLE
jgi:hypothetical protein